MDTSSVSIAAPDVTPMHHIKIVSRECFDDRAMPESQRKGSDRSEVCSNFVELCISPFLLRPIPLKYYNQYDDRQTLLSFSAEPLGDIYVSNRLLLLDLR